MCVMKNNGVFIFLMCQPLKKLKNYLIFAFMIQQIIFNHLVPEMTDEMGDACINSSLRGGSRRGQFATEYVHTLEGPDDMPAHAKSTLSGVSLTVPITNGRLNLGTWQGIYFYEYRNDAIIRKIDL